MVFHFTHYKIDVLSDFLAVFPAVQGNCGSANVCVWGVLKSKCVHEGENQIPCNTPLSSEGRFANITCFHKHTYKMRFFPTSAHSVYIFLKNIFVCNEKFTDMSGMTLKPIEEGLQQLKPLLLAFA